MTRTRRPSRRSAIRRYRRRSFPVKTVVMVVAIIALVVAFWAFSRSEQQAQEQTAREQQKQVQEVAEDLCLVKIPDAIASEPVAYKAMTISFNPELHIPNYVAWELTDAMTRGTSKRADKFVADPAVKGCAVPEDYRNSGYDRGHMFPAGDAKWDAEAMQQTFFLTNICPQANALNTGLWRSLEEKCRTWARLDKGLVIVCGPVVTDRMRRTIGQSKVAVPERFFKVILAPHANPPRAIGFVMSNRRQPGGLQATAMSVDDVEAITGYDFFSALPDDIEQTVEATYSFPSWDKRKNK